MGKVNVVISTRRFQKAKGMLTLLSLFGAVLKSRAESSSASLHQILRKCAVEKSTFERGTRTMIVIGTSRSGDLPPGHALEGARVQVQETHLPTLKYNAGFT